MQYCRTTTTNHSIALAHATCLQDINSLINEEGYQTTTSLFTGGEIVLNLDRAENIIAGIEGRLEKNKSMDLAFGIKNEDATKTQMLLVELKFKVTDLYAIKKKDLEQKVQGSTLILSSNPPICKKYIFIFKTENLAEAMHRLYKRMIPKIDPTYVAMDIQHLKATYFGA
jgi:hypothetical protein